MKLLLSFADDQSWRITLQLAKFLGKYAHPKAIATLNQLKADPDHRVVVAALGSMI